MNKQLINILSVLGVAVILMFTLMKTAFKKNYQFTCSKYILNTYLYIVLSFIIIALALLTAEHNNVEFRIGLLEFIGGFLITIGLLIFLLRINPKKIVLKHILWLLFILMIGAMFYPLYKNIYNNKTIIMAMITTITLVIVLSAFAYIRPDLISLSLGPVLLLLLVTAIVMEILSLIFLRKYRMDPTSKLYKGITYFIIILFMVYILYDTKMLQIRAKECVSADYINESLNLFLDILNIFVRILALTR
jgi:FtsH-binding integral membrane protein